MDIRPPEQMPDGKFLHFYRGYSFIAEWDCPGEALRNMQKEIDAKIYHSN